MNDRKEQAHCQASVLPPFFTAPVEKLLAQETNGYLAGFPRDTNFTSWFLIFFSLERIYNRTEKQRALELSTCLSAAAFGGGF